MGSLWVIWCNCCSWSTFHTLHCAAPISRATRVLVMGSVSTCPSSSCSNSGVRIVLMLPGLSCLRCNETFSSILRSREINTRRYGRNLLGNHSLYSLSAARAFIGTSPHTGCMSVLRNCTGTASSHWTLHLWIALSNEWVCRWIIICSVMGQCKYDKTETHLMDKYSKQKPASWLPSNQVPPPIFPCRSYIMYM